jgi:hypothetical protein
MTHESSERRAIRKENREVKEPELAAPRMRSRARAFSQLDEWPVAADWSECDPRLVAPYYAEAEDALIVGQRSRDVRDLQAHRADVRCGRKAKPGGDDAMFLDVRRGPRCAAGFW